MHSVYLQNFFLRSHDLLVVVLLQTKLDTKNIYGNGNISEYKIRMAAMNYKKKRNTRVMLKKLVG